MNGTEIEIKKCCFTGYRPSKFSFSLVRNNGEYIEFENQLIESILFLIRQENCRVFYTGMAMGFDIIAAEIVLMLKKSLKMKEIKLVCVIPFKQQKDYLNEEWFKRYNNILNQCDQTFILSDEYYNGCYQRRNEFMVDDCDYVLTWYDGRSGGTRNTINYAKRKLRYIFNANSNFQDNLNNEQLMSDFKYF